MPRDLSELDQETSRQVKEHVTWLLPVAHRQRALGRNQLRSDQKTSKDEAEDLTVTTPRSDLRKI